MRQLIEKLNNYRQQIKFDQRIIIAITIITAAIITILAWVIRPNPQIGQAATELALTADNIRVFYQTRPGYWGLNNSIVIKNDLAAQGMIQNGEIKNAFGKTVKIGQDADGNIAMPGSRSFVVSYHNLDKSECTAMAAFRLNENASLSLLEMSLTNVTGTTEFNWGGTNKLPITKEEARKFCRENNTIAWRFE